MSNVLQSNRTRLGLRIEQARWELALPDGARRLIASGDFSGRENETLVRWLASDALLSKRILRWCNTPLYNLSKPYRSLEEASRVMDGRELAQLAVLAWVRGAFLPDRHIDLYSRERLWMHSMSVASVSSLIARTCNLADPQMAFIAGAFHDIGMLASERLDPESFADVLSDVDSLSPINAVEQDLLGWDHTQLGAAVLDHWGMPQSVVQAAASHHHPHLIAAKLKNHPEKIDPEKIDSEEIQPGQIDKHLVQTVCCVAMANYFCARSGYGSVAGVTLPTPRENVFEVLGIDAGLIAVLWQQLPAVLESVQELT